MEPGHFHFQVGDFKCTSISDGGHNYYLGAMFANVPTADVQAALAQRGLPVDHLYTPYTCLYVDTGSNRILVDLGGGSVMPMAGKLRENLLTAGIEPESIDTVIITHAHPDHIGGVVGDDGRLTCPRARYYICQREWDFWRSSNAARQAPENHVILAQDRLAHIEFRLNLVEAGCEIVPGVFAVDAAGHTPGHLALSFLSAGSQLLHVSDTALSPFHLTHPHWLPVFDIEPQAAQLSKQRIFDRAAAEEALVFAHHFPPFPSIGTIEKLDQGWLWRPVEGDH